MKIQLRVPNSEHRNHRHAFTLVEMLLVITIIGIIFIGMLLPVFSLQDYIK